MKWGIRRYQNEDGSLTEEGKRRYGAGNPKNVKKARDIYMNSGVYKDVANEVFESLNADTSSLDKVRNDIKTAFVEKKKTMDEFRDTYSELLNNEKTYTKYCVESDLAEFGNFGKKVDDQTLESMQWAAYLALFEDGQQGMINAYSLYNYDNGLQDKTSKLYTKIVSADDEIIDSASKIIQNELDKVGGNNLTTRDGGTFKLSEGLARQMLNSYANTKSDDGFYEIGDYLCVQADEADTFNDEQKQAIKSAKKYVSKVKNNDEASTWWVFREAVENLGLDQNTLSDLSDSDWNKINEEIANIKNTPGSVPSWVHARR